MGELVVGSRNLGPAFLTIPVQCNHRNANAKMDHDCGGSTDTDDVGDEGSKEVVGSSNSSGKGKKGNSVEEELNLFLGEDSSSTDGSKVRAIEGGDFLRAASRSSRARSDTISSMEGDEYNIFIDCM